MGFLLDYDLKYETTHMFFSEEDNPLRPNKENDQ